MYVNIRFRRPFCILMILLFCLVLLYIVRQDVFLKVFDFILHEVKYFLRHMLRRTFWRAF